MTTYTNSCAPISLPCQVGVKFINPCTCHNYLECQTDTYGLIVRPCGLGTAYNHQTGFCVNEQQVLIGNGTPVCDKDEPWGRCKEVDNFFPMKRLKDFCVGSGGGGDGGGDDGGGGGGDVGAIVGGLTAVVVAVVVVAVVLMWWRKRNCSKSNDERKMDFRPSLPRRKKEEDEEVYDVIEEKNSKAKPVHNPAYGRQSREEKTEYDNPAFSQTEKSDYSPLDQSANATYNPGLTDQSSTNFGAHNGAISYVNTGEVTPNITRKEDFTRSIHIEGKEVMVEDQEGYHVGFPSGTMPRQPSPLVPPTRNHERREVRDPDPEDGYQLGQAPGSPYYMQLEKTEY